MLDSRTVRVYRPDTSMRPKSILGLCLAGTLPLVANACVGDPAPTNAAQPDGGAASVPQPPSGDGGTGDGATSGAARRYCDTVPAPVGSNSKETVFCEDFEGFDETRWDTFSENGSFATTDFEGSKVIDFTMNAIAAGDFTGPRLFWRKVPAAAEVELSFDFMLLEGPSAAAEDGLLWFGRIGTLGGPESSSVGFGAHRNDARIDYTTLLTINGVDLADDETFSFAPKAWTRVKLHYKSNSQRTEYAATVGTNPPHSGEFGPADLIAGDGVYVGAFASGHSSAVRVRFDNIVIRVTAP